MAIMFMLATAVLVTVGTYLVRDARKVANEQTSAVAMAENAALSGLKDTISWFNRQQNQPVGANPPYTAPPNPAPIFPVNITTNAGNLSVSYCDEAFYPVYNTTQAVSTDTIDPTGNALANEFSPDGANSVSAAVTDGSQSRWERYEVNRQLPGGSVTNAVHDASGERGYGHLDGQGLVWDIVSTGYYYMRRDFNKTGSVTSPYYWTKDFKTTPNKILATARMATEIRKISSNLPGGYNSGLFLPNPSKLNVTTNTYVSDDPQFAASKAWVSPTNFSPVTSGSNEIQGPGCGACVSITSASLQAFNVFGISVPDFASLGGQNLYRPTTATNLTSIPEMSIIYYDGDLTVDPAGSNANQQLIGPNGIQSGILVINGNFTMKSTATTPVTLNSYYGLVYVTGSVELDGSSISGALILGGTNSTGVTLKPVGSNQASISSNPDVINDLRTRKVTGYLEDVSARKKFLAIPNL